MKRFLSFFLSLLMINTIILYAPLNVGAVTIESLTFEMNDDNSSYSVTACEESVTGNVNIPETYNGLPVTAVGDFAFENCKNITTVEFPDSVISIGEGAFSNCTGLTSVEFPENYPSQGVDTIIVNDCQKLSQWNNYSTSDCEADTENFILGIQSIHSSNGEMVCLKDEYDMVNNNLVLKLKINSFSQGSRLYLQVLNTSDWSNRVNYELMRGTSTTPVGEWREITVPYTGYTWKSSKDFDFSNINFIRIYAQGEVDWNLQYTAQRPIKNDKAMISFTFDDGYASQYTGIEILGERDIPGTIFYVPEAATNGSSYYLKIPHLQELVEKYSTDIEVHGGSSYNNMSNEELISHWESTQKLFKDNGLGEGRYMAYPNGMHEDRVVQLARRYFDACRTIQYYIPFETIPVADMYRIRAISSIGKSANNVEYVKDKIDRAIASKSWLILVFHKIGDVTGDTMYCSESDLGEIADYAKRSGADLLTFAEGVNKITSESINIGENAFASCINLKSIELPSSVKSVGKNAFGYYYNAGQLEKIDNFIIKGTKNSASDFYAEDNSFYFEEICDHSLSDWENCKKVTCTENGINYKKCVFCKKIIQTEDIVAAGHKTVYDERIKPTCTQTGKTYGSHCSVCNKVFEAQVIIPAKGHNYSDVWILDKAAGCTKKGSKSRHCSDCDSLADVTIIEPTGHYSSEWIIDKEATYYKPGRKHKKCEICHADFVSETVPQLKCNAPIPQDAINSKAGIKFSWDKVEGADSYEILRKKGNGKWIMIATVKGTVTSYTDKTVKSGTIYKYTVRARNEAGISKYNTTGLTIKFIETTVLKTPVSAKNGITLKWSKVTGAQGYVVYRKKGNGKFIRLTTFKGAGKVSYVDKSAKKGIKYTYKLKAYSGKTFSAFSNSKTLIDNY